jgi:AbrB family looped-hinge helix DNA binding protein
MQEATVQVRQRGTLTLPAELRDKYGIQPGDTYRLVDLDGILILTPMVPMVPELAREIERLRLEAGLSVEELLVALREQREQYYVEHYEGETEVSESVPGEYDTTENNANPSAN